MDKAINKVKTSFQSELKSCKTSENLEQLRIKYLGRKGQLTDLFNQFGALSNKEKPKYGKTLNILKSDLTTSYNEKLATFNLNQGNNDKRDFSLPGYAPARDMQDTFFIDSDIVLRTHTSNVQIHLMENQDPPLRHICCGRVFRNEAVSYKSFCLFHQVEGLVINESSSFAEMKGTLEYFAKEMFGKDTKMRFRPSYFPFTEPSAEVDIWNDKLNQWMEILGCGMVNPNVLENVGYDSEKYQGFAFGMGIERIAMIKYGIRDIRLFYQNDKRFLEQF